MGDTDQPSATPAEISRAVRLLLAASSGPDALADALGVGEATIATAETGGDLSVLETAALRDGLRRALATNEVAALTVAWGHQILGPIATGEIVARNEDSTVDVYISSRHHTVRGAALFSGQPAVALDDSVDKEVYVCWRDGEPKRPEAIPLAVVRATLVLQGLAAESDAEGEG